jgi:uncharacterized repeat protein (TIGR01451 family)
VGSSGIVYVAGDGKETGVFWDVFLAGLRSDGSREWNIFLGYTYGHDYGMGVAPDGNGHVYVAGFSRDSWGSPINSHSGESDAFAAKLQLPAQADVGITKSVNSNIAAPGDPVTYTLSFSNGGNTAATGVTITDIVPNALTNVSYVASGVVITPTGGHPYTWQVQDLAPGSGGVITISGNARPDLSSGTVFYNTATITSTTTDTNPDNDSSTALVLIPSSQVYLPFVVK